MSLATARDGNSDLIPREALLGDVYESNLVSQNRNNVVFVVSWGWGWGTIFVHVPAYTSNKLLLIRISPLTYKSYT